MLPPPEFNGFTLYGFLRGGGGGVGWGWWQEKLQANAFLIQDIIFLPDQSLQILVQTDFFALVTKISCLPPLPQSVQAWVWKFLLQRKKACSLLPWLWC